MSSISLHSIYSLPKKDPKLKQLIDCLEREKLPNDDHVARKVAAQATSFILMDKILHLLDGRPQNRRRAVVPCSTGNHASCSTGNSMLHGVT